MDSREFDKMLSEHRGLMAASPSVWLERMLLAMLAAVAVAVSNGLTARFEPWQAAPVGGRAATRCGIEVIAGGGGRMTVTLASGRDRPGTSSDAGRLAAAKH